MTNVQYEWRGEIDNAALNALHAAAFDHPVFADDWAAMLRRHSLGWVVVNDGAGLVGFLNVPWDGGMHAWLQDVIVAPRTQRRGVGARMVALAVEQVRVAGCEWLHVDFDEEHREFYIDACGFQPSQAGLLRL